MYLKISWRSDGSASVSLPTPMPPGTSRTSRFSGGELKVWVGTMDCEKLDLKGFLLLGGLVGTGSRVFAIMLRFIGNVVDRTLKASSGPKTSSAWKAGYTITP